MIKVHIVIRLFLLLSGILFSYVSVSQDHEDTLYLNGPSYAHLSKYARYWVDYSNQSTLENAEDALLDSFFEHWAINSTLNLGLNPYPLWLHLNLKNEYPDPVTYWWSLYSHADTVILYMKNQMVWTAVDTVLFSQMRIDRSAPTRFLAIPIYLNPGESGEFLMKIRNLRSPQHAITDITTPDHNLLWEKQFYWTIGFFIGALVFVAFLNMILGLITRQRVFYMFSLYVLIVSLIILQEELLIVLYPSQNLMNFFMRFSSMGLTIIGCGLHFIAIKYVVSPPKGMVSVRISKALLFINRTGLIYGLIFTIVYFAFKEEFHFGQTGYRLIWYVSIVIIITMMVSLVYPYGSERSKMALKN